MSENCFPSAVSSARPRGTRVIEVFSPKLNRRLQCFGEHLFEQWVRLEADPTIQTFCERPVFLDRVGTRLADFWVLQEGEEALLIVDAESPVATLAQDGIELPVRSVPGAELAAARTWIDNWERMLPVIASCRSQLTPPFLQSILHFVSEPMQLSRIEHQFIKGDPTLIRAAIFTLLHVGSLQAPQLHTEQLTFLTRFHPVGVTYGSSSC
jgi:hypothetical protein